tara:strand:+ start:133 stop:714 length:582 start_codon:yes stop_codon:yes gene_type:complete
MKICSQCSIEKPQEDFYSGRNKCKVCYLGNKKKFVKNNPEKVRESKRKYYIENVDKILLQKKEYRKRNRPSIREYQKEYNKEYVPHKLKTDKIYKIKYVLRKLIAHSMWNKGYTKKSRTFEILGISYEEFSLYMERQFVKGMSWDNHGEWHIDHIIPLASAITEADVIRLNYYTNLQPLWAKDNLSKGSKIIS